MKKMIKIKLFFNYLDFDEQLDLNYEVSALRKSIDIAIKTSEEQKNPKLLVEVKYWKKN